jgi:tetratricopeptide (TPR) repeat protein
MARWNPLRRRDPAAKADELFRAGRLEEARAAYAAAVATYQREIQARPGDLTLNIEIALMTYNVGRCLAAMDRFDEAAVAHSGAAAILDAVQRFAAPQDKPRLSAHLASALTSQAFCLTKTRQWEPALAASRRAVEIRRAVSSVGADLGGALLMFLHVRAASGLELDDAQRAYNDAMAVYMNLLNAEPDLAYAEHIYVSELDMAAILQHKGDIAAAQRLIRQAESRHLDGLIEVLRAQRG